MSDGHKTYKSIICLVIVILIFFSMQPAITETKDGNDYSRRNARIYSQTGESYAWTDEKLFIAKGFDCDPEEYVYYWHDVHFCLISVDKNTGDVKTLIRQIDAYGTALFIDNNKLFLICEDNDYGNYGVSICVFDVLTENFLYMCTLQLGSYFKDVIVFDDVVYFVTENDIISWDYTKKGGNHTLEHLYTFKSDFDTPLNGNSLTNNHVMIEKGNLYFQEADSICSLNLESKKVTELCHICEPDFNRETSRLLSMIKECSKYIVLNGMLYYYDWNECMTVIYDIETKQRKTVNEEFHFKYCSDDYIIISKIESDEGGLYKYKTTDYLIQIDKDTIDLFGNEPEWTELQIPYSILPVGNNKYIYPYDLPSFDMWITEIPVKIELWSIKLW